MLDFIEKMITDKTIEQNNDFIEMINWVVLTGSKLFTKENVVNKLDELGVKDKVDEIIRTVSQYFKQPTVLLKQIDSIPYLTNLVDKDGMTALMKAAGAGLSDVALKLIEMGAKIDEKDENGMTALMHAAKERMSDVAIKLIEMGAKIDEKYEDGTTVLMDAASEGLSDVAIKLIEMGARIDEKNQNGMTALMKAAGAGESDVAIKLIEMGAKLDEQDNLSKTAIDHAKEFYLIRERLGIKENRELVDLMEVKYQEMLRQKLQTEPKPQHRSSPVIVSSGKGLGNQHTRGTSLEVNAKNNENNKEEEAPKSPKPPMN